jgi:hypothetical protein
MILIAGGDGDPNTTGLVRRAASRSVPHVALLVGAGSCPRIVWDIARDRLELNGAAVRPEAVFLRYDIFAHLGDGRPESQKRAARWYDTVLSWVLAHEQVAFFNRRYGTRHVSKPLLLHLARSVGIAIPQTVVTNEIERFDASQADRWIVKPVNGGEYTRVLADASGDEAWLRQFSSEPTIVQRRLDAPDLRIYRVGNRWFAFTLQSEAIDYRIDDKLRIRLTPATADLVVPLARLMDHLGLEFGAADYKRCPETGRYLFLEVNSAPMFTAFDRVVNGALCDRMIDWLLTPNGPTHAPPASA